MKSYLPFALIALVAAAALGSGVALYRHEKSALAASEAAAFLEASSGKPGARPLHVRGGDKATVTIEEFGDFQCPPCGNFASVLGRIEHDYGSRLRVIYREYPLPIHAHAAQAARVAEAAGLQGQFWEMHDELYRNQNTWAQLGDATKAFAEYAEKLGLDQERFAADIESEQVKERIIADQARADSLGVNSTPTLFLNNSRIPPASGNEAALRGLIDDALSGKPPSSPAPSPTATTSPEVK